MSLFTIWDGILYEQKDKKKSKEGAKKKKQTEIRDTDHPQVKDNGITDNISREKEKENMNNRKRQEKYFNPFFSLCIWLWCDIVRIHKWMYQMIFSNTFQFTNQLIKMSGYL